MAADTETNLDIDGKKEITIKHSRNKILLETLYFVFWVAIGCLSIVVGILTLNQSLAFRIIFMILDPLLLQALNHSKVKSLK